jgi:hypothetical protein
MPAVRPHLTLISYSFDAHTDRIQRVDGEVERENENEEGESRR